MDSTFSLLCLQKQLAPEMGSPDAPTPPSAQATGKRRYVLRDAEDRTPEGAGPSCHVTSPQFPSSVKAQTLEILLPKPSEEARRRYPGQGERTPPCYSLLETKSLGPRKGLGDWGVLSRKLAEEHWSRRPNQPSRGTEGKERVEQ